MNQSNFRSQPVWKKARQLALALSLLVDAFPQTSRAESHARSIRNAFVDLLVWIPRASESGFYHGQAESCLKKLADAIERAREHGLLPTAKITQITRQLKAISSALSKLHTSGGGAAGYKDNTRFSLCDSLYSSAPLR